MDNKPSETIRVVVNMLQSDFIRRQTRFNKKTNTITFLSVLYSLYLTYELRALREEVNKLRNNREEM